MQASKEHPVAQALAKIYQTLVIPALQEGGLNFGRPEFVGAGFMADEVRARIGEYDFAIVFLAGPGEPEDNPAVGVLRVTVALARQSGPTVTLDRHSDKEVWYMGARGTLALPVGHPLREFAHSPKYLDLEANRMETEFGDKPAFQLIRKVPRLLEHNTL